MSYFIDSHCHFFNIDSIPLSSTLSRLKISPLLGPIPTGITFLFLKKILQKHERFIKFFENDVESNIRRITTEMLASNPEVSNFSARTKIMTPLIMDFEEALDHERLTSQVANLKRGISNCKKHLDDKKIKILPFLGIDLRRLDNLNGLPIADWFDKFLDEELNVEFKYDTPASQINTLQNGNFIGVKLYPSLGGKLDPQKHLPFLQLLQERNVPITAHCQEDSFKQGDEKDKTLVQYAHPSHWHKMFESGKIDDLKINFAHFGGESEVEKTIAFNLEDDTDGISYPAAILGSKKTWTYQILKLLKKYPKTYSDLSAFDYRNKKASLALGWLIALDKQGKFNDMGSYKLSDKLLFGSDYPMLLNYTSNYQQVARQFAKATDFHKLNYKGYGKPPREIDGVKIGGSGLREKLTEVNPIKFLFS